MMLKKTAVALALSLGLVAGANAAEYDLGTFSGAAIVGDVYKVVGSFTDIFSFSLTTPLSSAGSVISVNTGNIIDLTFTSVELYAGTFGGANMLVDTLDISNTPTSSSSSGSGNYLTGNYFFKVAGFGYGSDGLKGSYLVGVEVTQPVPEPESYAMLLAGLGLMGTVARRRKSKAA